MFFVEDLGYLIKILNFCYLGQGQITLEKYTSLKLHVLPSLKITP